MNWSIAAIATICLAFLGYWSVVSFRNAPVVSESESPGEILVADVTHTKTLLSLAPMGDTQDREILWLLPQTETSADSIAYGQWDRGLLRSKFQTREDGAVVLSGDWAGYKDPNGRNLGYGNLSGKLEWIDNYRSALATFTFHDVTDNTSETLTFRGSALSLGDTVSHYWRTFEESEWLGTLLYAELLPRDMEWALSFEAMLPAAGIPRLAVPVDESAEIAADGVLEEATWQQVYYDDRGRIGFVELPNATVMARANQYDVVLSISISTSDSPESLHIVLQKDLDRPRSMAVIRSAKQDATGTSSASQFIGDREMYWECDWTIASALTNKEWHAEIAIPHGGVSALLESHWRINISVQFDDETIWFGDTSILETYHGALLTFTTPTGPASD